MELNETQKKELTVTAFHLKNELDNANISIERNEILLASIPDTNTQFKADTTAELEALQVKKSELELTLNSYVVQIGSDYDALYAIFASEYKAMFG
jgi:hypothetical protein